MRHLGGRLDVCVLACKGRAGGGGWGAAIHPGESPEGRRALTVTGELKKKKRHGEMWVEGEEAQVALPKNSPKKWHIYVTCTFRWRGGEHNRNSEKFSPPGIVGERLPDDTCNIDEEKL